MTGDVTSDHIGENVTSGDIMTEDIMTGDVTWDYIGGDGSFWFIMIGNVT